jgi:hypothetical protein
MQLHPERSAGRPAVAYETLGSTNAEALRARAAASAGRCG